MISFSPMVLSATLRRRLPALVGASVVVLGMGPRAAAASPAVVSADDGELQDSARQLEAAGEYEAAAASWAKIARVSLDPMALLYADSAWARAFADDGEPSHLCAALDLSSWLLDQPSVTAGVREDILEIRESQLAAMPADLRCPEAAREVPLLVGRPPSATATSSSFPQPSKAPDEDEAARGTKNPAIRGGTAVLAVGSLLGITSVIGGGITLQAVAELNAARVRHIAAGTGPSETERAKKEEVYGRGKTAEAVAIATGTAAAVALGVGAALLIRGRRRAQREATLVPVVGPQNAGIAIGGRF